MRAIWDCWQNGTPLHFTGEFYRLTLMTPFFSPKPMAYPMPPIYIAGVNPLMCRLAGELCEGFHVHPLHSVKYLQEHVLPNIMQGAAKTGRSRHDISLMSAVFVITGDSAQELAEMRDKVRMQIAFYASTRSYWPVLEAHGWGDVGRQLNRMAAQGDWHGMARAITDEMLDVYAVTGLQTKFLPCSAPGTMVFWTVLLSTFPISSASTRRAGASSSRLSTRSTREKS